MRDEATVRSATAAAYCDVAIIGAGPYGLAAAAHVRAADGLDVRVFGDPMRFWRRQMPAGMFLRSPWDASHISDPDADLTLDRYEVATGTQLERPIPLDSFIRYGHWFQEQVAADVDRRTVAAVKTARSGFVLQFDDGDALETRRVIVAAGIAPFAWKPHEFRGFPSELVSHASEHADLGRLAGKEIVIVGAGQSALESAALLHEAGAGVRVLVRAPAINWLIRSGLLHRLGPLTRLLYAPSDVGPAGVSWLIALPGLFRQIPRRIQEPLAVRSIRPAGSSWLVPRLEDVPLITARTVVAARVDGSRIKLELDDGSRLGADHVLLGTGYRVDVSRYPFLSGVLLEKIARVDGYPVLGRGFESSVPGLHFLGAPAAWSFGPLARFVAGSRFAARSVAKAIIDRQSRFGEADRAVMPRAA
jgi:pyridine nucleotide-disulfide oxidoreductase